MLPIETPLLLYASTRTTHAMTSMDKPSSSDAQWEALVTSAKATDCECCSWNLITEIGYVRVFPFRMAVLASVPVFRNASIPMSVGLLVVI